MITRLVRSGALGTWRVPGAEHQVRPVRDRFEHAMLLLDKLREESEEVIDAVSKDHLSEEIGDVLAVLQAIADLAGIPWDEVIKLAREKEDRSGSFKIGLVWDRSIGEEERRS